MTLPIKELINVTVNLSPVSVVRSSFSLGLIIGKTTVISAAERVASYTSLAEMITAGFIATDEEYLAATIYFSQKPTPTKVLIGRHDDTGAETVTEAITACRAANEEWYACFVCNIVKADVVLAAAYIEATDTPSVLFYTTADADVPLGTAGNVFLTLQAANYSRSIGQYSSDPYAAVAIMGYAMASNTSLAGSAYTLAYKIERGIDVEELTSAELELILGANGNAYVNQGSYYNVFRQGLMADGSKFDELVGLDTLTNAIQTSVMNLLTSLPKVPQTEAGVSLLTNVISSACADSVETGFIAPGTWDGPAILNLDTDDVLSAGYVIMSESIASQSTEDRAARIAPPIYVCVKLAGAIEYAVIQVNVNR